MARPQADDYDEKRLNILKRSAALFARNGFGGTSTAMIAQACGCSKALVYHYYGSKNDILFDILKHHLKNLVVIVEDASRATGDPKERVFAIASALLESYRGADAEHEVQISSLNLLPSAQREKLKDLEREIVSVVSRAIGEAIPSIATSRALRPLTMSFFAMVNWHFLWFREGKGLTRDGYARMAVDLLLTGAEAASSRVEEPSTPAKKSPVAKLKGGRAGRINPVRRSADAIKARRP